MLYEHLLDRARDARFVLLGEASHGTHEFYRECVEITKRLIAEGGCTAVAVEADWPDAYRVNRYVRGSRRREPRGGAPPPAGRRLQPGRGLRLRGGPRLLRERVGVVAQAVERAGRLEAAAAVERVEAQRVEALGQPLGDMQRADAAEAPADRGDREAERQVAGRRSGVEAFELVAALRTR